MSVPTIIVHGGARTFEPDLKEVVKDGVRAAARQGYDHLIGSGNAMDAVVEAVSAMEDNMVFNAGHGSMLNLNGDVEMDAIVIDGRNLASGAVCGLQGCANPVQVARLVMEKTKHCLLTADGARAFMKSQGIQPIPNRELVTQKAVVEFETYKKYSTAVEKVMLSRSIPPVTSDCDTVGAVAIDGNGNVAAATSTGGITAKLPGRVGDSCIIGSGAYADNAVGAVSTTGLGESIMRVCLARRIAELLEKGETADQASKHALDFMSKRVGGTAGVIVISAAGVSGTARVAHHFTTTNMVWAAISNGYMRWGIDPDQEESSELKA
ncbi:isoaspartyl peptidase/l-asparaginase [Plakobranchus ocellatus]|uniref:Isoaspartyl peptidase/l-asparaginase n=1 Tax=Plakobranchus ocellatus TaxID=259542 RepID=A0AAV4A9P3_9GAST|nr:isoaspartyl peptidase/l-asparaginase [Plakobranchus ocellatus]